MNYYLTYYPSPSPARSLPSCVKYTTCASSPLTNNCQLITLNSSYTFSSKERDTETGLSYFGARYYNSDLGIWLSVDPMSDKYASLSPYNYCANNPVKLVDPNGEDIEITTETDANGKQIITINFTAELVNKSSHSLDKRSLERMRDDIKSGITDIYSGEYEGAMVKVNVDIISDGNEKSNDLMKESSRHSIYIVDKCSNPDYIAEAMECGNYINIQWDIGQESNDNNLKRTAAHEFGHLLGLPHVETSDNIMNPDGIGKNLSVEQIREAVSNYRYHKINIGISTHAFDSQAHKDYYLR